MTRCSIVTVERRPTAVVKIIVPMQEIRAAQRAARATIAAALPSLGAGAVGPAFTLFRTPADGRLDMEPGVIVGHGFAPAGEVVPSETPAGRAARFVLVGPYDGLAGAWGTLFGWCEQQGLTPAGVNWEIYRDGTGQPETTLHALLA